MTCDDRRDQVLLDVFGGLDAEESVELRAHIDSGCPTCAGHWSEAQSVAAQFASNLTPITPNPAVLQQLMKKVSASPDSYKLPTRSRWPAALAASVVAAVAGSAITAAVMWSNTRANPLLGTPDLRYVSLAAGDTQHGVEHGAQHGAHGRIFWDGDHGVWHVYVFDLAPPSVGKTYELWFIGDDGRKTAAGLVDVNANGEGNITVGVPANLGKLAAAAITDEKMGGVDQPQGTIQLVGKIE